MRRRPFQILTWTSLLVFLAGAGLWVTSSHSTYVFMAGLPGERCVLFTSHRGGWVELTCVRNGWREPGVGAWGKDWRTTTKVVPLGADDRGPLKLWQRPSDVFNWGPPGLRGEFSLRRGTPAVMVDPVTRRPLLDRSGGVPPGTWDNVAPGSAHWIFPTAWEVRAPHWALVAAAFVIPVGRGVRRLATSVRRRLTYRAGCCRHCGYDLRATPEQCPECGHRHTPIPAG